MTRLWGPTPPSVHPSLLFPSLSPSFLPSFLPGSSPSLLSALCLLPFFVFFPHSVLLSFPFSLLYFSLYPLTLHYFSYSPSSLSSLLFHPSTSTPLPIYSLSPSFIPSLPHPLLYLSYPSFLIPFISLHIFSRHSFLISSFHFSFPLFNFHFFFCPLLSTPFPPYLPSF